MSITNPEAGELLRREILDQAENQKAEILRQAQETIGTLIAQAEKDVQKAREEKLRAAQAEAKRNQEAILATVLVETSRAYLAQVEQLLQSIHDQARDKLRTGQGVDRRAVLAGCATEALTRMNGNDFCLRLSGKDLRELGPGLVEEVRHRWARPWLCLEIGEDPEAPDNAWLLQDKEGRQIWELGLEARLHRLWPELRRQIAAQTGLVSREETRGGQE